MLRDQILESRASVHDKNSCVSCSNSLVVSLTTKKHEKYSRSGLKLRQHIKKRKKNVNIHCILTCDVQPPPLVHVHMVMGGRGALGSRTTQLITKSNKMLCVVRHYDQNNPICYKIVEPMTDPLPNTDFLGQWVSLKMALTWRSKQWTINIDHGL